MKSDARIETNSVSDPSSEGRGACRKELPINQGRRGSVRNINGRIFFDFRYMGIRVREPYNNLEWDGENGMEVTEARAVLNLIFKGIAKEKFVFSEVFPNSRHAKSFTERETNLGVRNIMPYELLVGDYIAEWLEDLRQHETRGMTLNGYKSINTHYIIPYWGQMNFAQLKKKKLGDFYEWARDQEIRGEPVSNNSINTYVKQLIRIATHAAEANEWPGYKPFFGYRPLKVTDPYNDIDPFTLDEQSRIFKALQLFWRPYVEFAFASGVSVGELNAIRLSDLKMGSQPTVVIDEAWTREENGKTVIGTTKNSYRMRTLQMNPRMLQAVEAQFRWREKKGIESQFFFCKMDGSPISDSTWFITNVWRPTLKRIDMSYRSFREARHSFATEHLSKGGDPLKIAAFLGHRDAQMVLKRYAKFKKKYEGVGVGMDDHVQRDFGV